MTILLAKVFLDLTTTSILEVGVNVREVISLRVDESEEQQVIHNWVNLSDSKGIVHE